MATEQRHPIHALEPAAHVGPLDGVVIGIGAWNARAATAIQESLRVRGALLQPLAMTSAAQLAPRYDIVLTVLNSSRDPLQHERETAMLREVAKHERTIALLQEPPLIEGVSDIRDFVLAPFRPDEIVARILRVLDEPRPDVSLTAGNLELLVATREVRIGGRRIGLTFMEFDVLRVLLAADGGVVTRVELARVLDHHLEREGRAMDVHVHRLRAKLPGLEGASIETVRGAGYRLSRG